MSRPTRSTSPRSRRAGVHLAPDRRAARRRRAPLRHRGRRGDRGPAERRGPGHRRRRARSTSPAGPDVFAGPTDVAYVGRGHRGRPGQRGAAGASPSAGRGREALPARRLAAAEVPVELRGAGQCSRQVRNFGTPDALPAGSIIACEVITPGGNWSSYPAHKHDEAERARVGAGGDLLLRDRGRPERRAGPRLLPHLVLARTRDRHLRGGPRPGHVLVPYGWHGPAAAAPGHDMYYLNVMAGPGPGTGLADHRPPGAGLGAEHLGRPAHRPPTHPERDADV